MQIAGTHIVLSQGMSGYQRVLEGKKRGAGVRWLPLKAAAWKWRSARGKALSSVSTCSQRNHTVNLWKRLCLDISIENCRLQMLNYFSNAKDDCKFVIYPVSQQPRPPWVNGKKNVVHRKLKWSDQFVLTVIFLSFRWLISLISSVPQGRLRSHRRMALGEVSSSSFSRITLVPGASLRNHLKITF